MGVLLVLLVIVSISLPSIKAIPPYGFSIDMIHRDYSPLSPYYNSSMNQSEALKNAFMRSITRVNTLFHLNTTTHGIKSEAPVIVAQGDYLMKLSIGNPPLDSFVQIDTGSELFWIQCEPCDDCFYQKSPIFDPINSSTYQDIYCNMTQCDLVAIRACGEESVCRYQVKYADDSFTVGELGSDTISFGTSPQVVAPNTLFGCGHVNQGIFEPYSTGIVGLGQGPLSLVSQLGDKIGHKFAYCLVPQDSKVNTKIKFGSDAQVYGNRIVTVPFIANAPNSLYYIRIREIYFNFKYVVRPTTNPDILIDSGTTVTFLEKNLYDSVVTAVKEVIGYYREPVKYPPAPLTLCYRNVTLKEVPEVIFIFDGANLGLKLNTFNVFQMIRDKVCLIMAPSKGNYSIIGSIAQVNYKVLYDLQAKTVSFAPTDCNKE